MSECLKSIEPTIPVGIKYLEDEIEKDKEAKEAYEAKKLALQELEKLLSSCRSELTKQ